ncbi:hypothetical protein V491_08407, partial [Pseudogymnoascus sp. VKM F-3775]
EDYIAWKLPEEEDPDEYPFPLTLRTRRPSGSAIDSLSAGPTSPADPAKANGEGKAKA